MINILPPGPLPSPHNSFVIDEYHEPLAGVPILGGKDETFASSWVFIARNRETNQPAL